MFRKTATALEFWIHVTPRARRQSVRGIHGDALRVVVTATPARGAANEACAPGALTRLCPLRAAPLLPPISDEDETDADL
jgi:hypothetical protein